MLPAAASVVATAAFVGRLASDRKHNERIERRENAKRDAAKAEGNRKGRKERQEEALQHAREKEQQQILGFFYLWLIAAVPMYCLLLYLLIYRDLGRRQAAWLGGATLAAGLYGMLRAKSASQVQILDEPLTMEEPLVELIQVKENLTGTWLKDNEASTSMMEVIEMVNLNRLVRTAIKLVKGVQIVQTPEIFEFAVFSLIGWFKVREEYSMNGELSQHKRRDLRRGHHEGRVALNNAGHLYLYLEWTEPYPGKGHDEFWLQDRDTLHVKSVCTMAGKTAGYLTVYRRKH